MMVEGLVRIEDAVMALNEDVTWLRSEGVAGVDVVEMRSRVLEWLYKLPTVTLADVPDQTAKADAGKIEPMHVPPELIEDVAEVRRYGNQKYHDPENWKEVEVERYWNALFRHLLACMKDRNSMDPESGIENYKHMACNIAFICALERRRNNERTNRQSD